MVFKFSIDETLNKYIPPNRLHRLPASIRRFLGHHQPSPKSDILVWGEILITTFCGIALLEGVFKSHTVFSNHNAPLIIASYGATAILCFNSIKSPLAQPRNILFGHFFASLIGICIQKLFLLSQGGRDNYWASGALSVATASVFMAVTNCIHPPAGASALLPSVDESIRDMSWWYLPAQLVSSLLIIGAALISTNIIRSYPEYWWTPVPLPILNKIEDEEMQASTDPEESKNESGNEDNIKLNSNSTSVEILTNEINIPDDLILETEEINLLITLQKKLCSISNKNAQTKPT